MFDSSKARNEGSEAAKFYQNSKDNNKTFIVKKDWRATHESLVSMIRAGREYQQELAMKNKQQGDANPNSKHKMSNPTRKNTNKNKKTCMNQKFNSKNNPESGGDPNSNFVKHSQANTDTTIQNHHNTNSRKKSNLRAISSSNITDKLSKESVKSTDTQIIDPTRNLRNNRPEYRSKRRKNVNLEPEYNQKIVHTNTWK